LFLHYHRLIGIGLTERIRQTEREYGRAGECAKEKERKKKVEKKKAEVG
jgi:hypothetical protein